jgi:hypothetical protein
MNSASASNTILATFGYVILNAGTSTIYQKKVDSTWIRQHNPTESINNVKKEQDLLLA